MRFEKLTPSWISLELGSHCLETFLGKSRLVINSVSTDFCLIKTFYLLIDLGIMIDFLFDLF